MPAETKPKFEVKLGAATREAFGRALVELGRENKDVVVVDADLSKSTMTAAFASRPGDIIAGVGPSIGPDHYEVGPDVIERVRPTFGDNADGLLPVYGDRHHFDLWAANRLSLERAGVNRIEVAGLCTACHTHHWYSHRAEQGKTGRFGALIAVQA